MEARVTDRRIGVEIECVVPIIGVGDNHDVQTLLASILSRQGIRTIARSYTHRPLPDDYQMAIEHDVSLEDENRYPGLRWSKVEVKTAPMTWQALNQVLPATLDVIRYCGARVNRSCGLHVHHHVPEIGRQPLIARNLQHLWWRFHHVLYGLVAPSRVTNRYCYPPQQADATQYDRCRTYPQLCDVLAGVSRYNGLNLVNLAVPSRLTVEWRIHSGTTDYDKIRAWVLSTQRWVEHAVQRSIHHRSEPVPNTRDGLNSLLVATGLKPNSRIYHRVSPELRDVGRYLLKRWKAFKFTDVDDGLKAAA